MIHQAKAKHALFRVLNFTLNRVEELNPSVKNPILQTLEKNTTEFDCDLESYLKERGYDGFIAAVAIKYPTLNKTIIKIHRTAMENLVATFEHGSDSLRETNGISMNMVALNSISHEFLHAINLETNTPEVHNQPFAQNDSVYACSYFVFPIFYATPTFEKVGFAGQCEICALSRPHAGGIPPFTLPNDSISLQQAKKACEDRAQKYNPEPLFN